MLVGNLTTHDGSRLAHRKQKTNVPITGTSGAADGSPPSIPWREMRLDCRLLCLPPLELSE